MEISKILGGDYLRSSHGKLVLGKNASDDKPTGGIKQMRRRRRTSLANRNLCVTEVQELRQRINGRERRRMHDLNSALDGLRDVMPPYALGPSVRKLPKIATLLLARNYILTLQNTVDELKRFADGLAYPSARLVNGLSQRLSGGGLAGGRASSCHRPAPSLISTPSTYLGVPLLGHPVSSAVTLFPSPALSVPLLPPTRAQKRDEHKRSSAGLPLFSYCTRDHSSDAGPRDDDDGSSQHRFDQRHRSMTICVCYQHRLAEAQKLTDDVIWRKTDVTAPASHHSTDKRLRLLHWSASPFCST